MSRSPSKLEQNAVRQLLPAPGRRSSQGWHRRLSGHKASFAGESGGGYVGPATLGPQAAADSHLQRWEEANMTKSARHFVAVAFMSCFAPLSSVAAEPATKALFIYKQPDHPYG